VGWAAAGNSAFASITADFTGFVPIRFLIEARANDGLSTLDAEDQTVAVDLRSTNRPAAPLL
jgi:hypothetical protein